MARGTDTRFAVIEDAADLLKMLPAAEQIVWPREAGDVAAVEEALRSIADRLPHVRASLRRHKRAMREMAAHG